MFSALPAAAYRIEFIAQYAGRTWTAQKSVSFPPVLTTIRPTTTCTPETFGASRQIRSFRFLPADGFTTYAIRLATS